MQSLLCFLALVIPYPLRVLGPTNRIVAQMWCEFHSAQHFPGFVHRLLLSVSDGVGPIQGRSFANHMLASRCRWQGRRCCCCFDVFVYMQFRPGDGVSGDRCNKRVGLADAWVAKDHTHVSSFLNARRVPIEAQHLAMPCST